MIFKVLLIGVILLLGVVVILPFILNVVGVPVFQFGSVGSGFAGSGGTTMLRSSDGGTKWEEATFLREKRLPPPAQIFSLTFHPTSPNVIFAGTKASGLWISSDGGEHWSKAVDPSRTLDITADVYRIFLGGSDPQILYLAVFQNDRGRVLKSENGGKTFKEVYFVTANRFGVFDLWVHPSDPNQIRIVTGQGGVLESRDGGKTWRVVRWFSEALTRLMVNPVFPSEMLVTTSSGKLFKTFDNGENWADLNEESAPGEITSPIMLNPFVSLISRRSIETLVADPNIFTTLYLGSKEGLLRSQDGGFSWQRLNVLIPPEALPVTAVAVKPGYSNIIFAAAVNQLHKSTDGGETWDVDVLPTKVRVRQILFHPLRPETMFIIAGR